MHALITYKVKSLYALNSNLICRKITMKLHLRQTEQRRRTIRLHKSATLIKNIMTNIKLHVSMLFSSKFQLSTVTTLKHYSSSSTKMDHIQTNLSGLFVG